MGDILRGHVDDVHDGSPAEIKLLNANIINDYIKKSEHDSADDYVNNEESHEQNQEVSQAEEKIDETEIEKANQEVSQAEEKINEIEIEKANQEVSQAEEKTNQEEILVQSEKPEQTLTQDEETSSQNEKLPELYQQPTDLVHATGEERKKPLLNNIIKVTIIGSYIGAVTFGAYEWAKYMIDSGDDHSKSVTLVMVLAFAIATFLVIYCKGKTLGTLFRSTAVITLISGTAFGSS